MICLQRECDSFYCKYDNRECSFGQPIWQRCSAIRLGIRCFDLFKNGHCDKACDSAECLFDGYDCREPIKECTPFYNCDRKYRNGVCDKQCNTEACEWDGLDCDKNEEKLAEGYIIIIVLVPFEDFQNTSIAIDFLRKLGRILRTVARYKKDEDGNDMIFPWKGDSSEATFKRIKRSAQFVSIVTREKRAAQDG